MSRLSSVVDTNHILNVVRRRCDDFGVTVTFDPYTRTASSNGKSIVFPAIKHPVTQDQMDTLYGFCIHECGHHKRNDAFKILNSAQPPDHVCALYNIIEDDGMERERAGEWLGDKSALSNMNTILVEQVAISWENAVANGIDIDQQPPEPLAAMAIGRLASLDWDHDNDVVTQRCINALPEPAKELIQELTDEGWVERCRKTETPHDTWDLTIDLTKRLYPDHDEDQMEQMRQDGHEKSDENQQGRDTSKDEQPAQVGDTSNGGAGTDEGQQASGEELGFPSDDGVRSPNGGTVSWKQCVLSEHTEWQEDTKPPGGFGIDWRGKKLTGKVGLMPTSQINVVDLAKRKNIRGEPKDHGYGSNVIENYMPTDAHSRAFANRIRRYIQSKARSVVEKEKYHGRLDKGAIVRLALPPIDGGEYNKRIFYDQRKHTMKDTAIFVLTDWSGSMIGNKMHYAADASQRLVHTFDRVLNVPVALAAFSNKRTPCDIGYIKRFNTRGLPAEEIAARYADFYSWCSANNDADSLNWAWHEILKRKESRKILIVLSDGCPAGQWTGHGDDNLKYITNEIEQDGKVELYGVGICSNAVERYYTNHRVLHDPSEINDTLFNVIKDGNNVK